MRKSNFIFLLVLALFSCRSPQRLVEKAIEKDSNVLSAYADTVTLERLVVDSIPVIKNDTIIWEKIHSVVEFDTVLQVRVVEVEKKKSRLEIRKEYQLEKALIKKDEKIAKMQFKLDELQAKLDARTDRTELRNETKQERSKNRWWLWFFLGAISMLIVRVLIDKFWQSLWKE
jgi:hypothetical protein